MSGVIQIVKAIYTFFTGEQYEVYEVSEVISVLPGDINVEPVYTEVEQFFHSLIENNPRVPDQFKQDPTTATLYFQSLVKEHNNISEGALTYDLWTTQQRDKRNESLTGPNITVCIGKLKKSPLRLYFEHQFIKFTKLNTPVYITNVMFMAFQEEYPRATFLWDFMYQECLVQYYPNDEDCLDYQQFFHQLDEVSEGMFQEFMEQMEFNPHEVIEYMLIFTGERTLQEFDLMEELSICPE